MYLKFILEGKDEKYCHFLRFYQYQNLIKLKITCWQNISDKYFEKVKKKNDANAINVSQENQNNETKNQIYGNQFKLVFSPKTNNFKKANLKR